MSGLPDFLEPGLRLVVCGTAAGNQAFLRGEYYVHPTNRFWDILHRVGLTPRRLEPSEAGELLRYGIGLSDVVKDFGGPDDRIPELAWDPAPLLDKIRRVRATGRRLQREGSGREGSRGQA